MSSSEESQETSDTSITATPSVTVNQNRLDTHHLTSFFSPDVFSRVLRDPIAVHRFYRFCQRSACGENLEFLEQVIKYHRLLNDLTIQLFSIQKSFLSPDSPSQINISHKLMTKVVADIEASTQSAIPNMEEIFVDTQDHIEILLAQDIYPRFVKHQITKAASLALADDRLRYQGLGDCFCLTDPALADNPITFASDGFVSVTGYSRKEIVPRNCRFLQGDLTSRASIRRLRSSIRSNEESVELLLNYRKNGEPFWNLLYVAPLVDQDGVVKFFLGGQINCSTTVQSHAEVMRVLSLGDEIDMAKMERSGSNGEKKEGLGTNGKTEFLRSLVKPKVKPESFSVRGKAGMEAEFLDRHGQMDIGAQLKAVHTAYSKYLVLKHDIPTSKLTISHYSAGVIDMLDLNTPSGRAFMIQSRDIFTVLGEYCPSASTMKGYRKTVLDNIKKGMAVSIELNLSIYAEVRKQFKTEKTEQSYVTHWTLIKDAKGIAHFVVLIISSKALEKAIAGPKPDLMLKSND